MCTIDILLCCLLPQDWMDLDQVPAGSAQLLLCIDLVTEQEKHCTIRSRYSNLPIHVCQSRICRNCFCLFEDCSRSTNISHLASQCSENTPNCLQVNSTQTRQQQGIVRVPLNEFLQEKDGQRVLLLLDQPSGNGKHQPVLTFHPH